MLLKNKAIVIGGGTKGPGREMDGCSQITGSEIHITGGFFI